MGRRSTWAVLVWVCTVTFPLPVSAQHAPASEGTRGETAGADEADARRLFEQGRVAYEEGRFEEALRHFEAAMALVRDVRVRVLMVLNIARAHDRLGHRAEAIDAYEQYIRLMPDGPRASEVRARIAALRRAEGSDPLAPSPSRGDGSGERGASWVPWAVAGGALLLGGVVAAVLLLPRGEQLPAEVGPVRWDTTALREGP